MADNDKAKKNLDPAALFERDDLDDAVLNADATGMVAEQREITEDEVILGVEGQLPDEDRPEN
ncbi:MAG TPA: hypothetical protein VE591_00610 [Candidatus Acidoferrum sp.]|jgi:hypothetical protein|nr:hypothetical protein [Candidatus Acidoferrum sp.]